MNNYLVLKTAGKGTKTCRTATVLELNVKPPKTLHVVGNIPELYHGMVIMLEVNEDNYVLEYSLVLNEKNVQALEKANIDVSAYQAVLEKHSVLKKDGIGWNVAKLGLTDIYKALPFEEADKVHKEMIDNATEPTRVEAINKKIIETARNKRKIAYKIEEYLGYFDSIEQEGAYQQLMVSLKMLCLQASRYGFKNGTVWDNEMKYKEDYIKANIKERKAVEYQLLSKYEIENYIATIQDKGLANEQINTLWSLETSIPCIITGGAGTGKTSVIQTLIECYAMHYSVENVLLIAPTGKASRRLAQKTKMPASTIHKALRKMPEEELPYYNENNLLPYRLIIVDESSMIDTSLMYDLLAALNPTSKIIFVGDHNQLFPVGYGEPFFNFLNELEVYTLKINHRQSEGTDILEVANKALAEEEFGSGRGVVVREISFDEIGRIIRTNDESTQIISPYNALNAQINAFLKKGDSDFSVGDKIMTLKNTKTYCNGDIGVVTKIDGKGAVVACIEGKSVKINKTNLGDVTLAYATTIHKMQGSEMDRIIMLIPKNDAIVDNHMLYTGFTRAREMLEVYFFDYSETT